MGVIGAGNYARSILLPELARTEARLAAVADLNGAAAAHAARKFGAGKALTDYREILADPAIQAVFVLVGHHLHARFVGEVVAAGKHVFVEKPLAITEEQLDGVRSLKLAFPDAANEPPPPVNKDDNLKDLTPQGPMVMAGFDPAHIKAYFPTLAKVTGRFATRWRCAADARAAIDLQADLKIGRASWWGRV